MDDETARQQEARGCQSPPLWPLALLTALWPVLVVLVCLALSIRDGHVPLCNPWVDGCTSISRTGRHGWAWFVFKAGMLPYATLLAAFWLACHGWLRELTGRGAAAMLAAGLTGTLFLILYATFLGSDGQTYQLLRRYGINVYFGGTWLAQALLVLALWRRTVTLPMTLPVSLRAVQAVLVAAVLLPGLVFYAARVWSGMGADIDRDRIENTMEWAAATLMQLVFVAVAAGWYRSGLRMRLLVTRQAPSSTADSSAD